MHCTALAHVQQRVQHRVRGQVRGRVFAREEAWLRVLQLREHFVHRQRARHAHERLPVQLAGRRVRVVRVERVGREARHAVHQPDGRAARVVPDEHALGVRAVRRAARAVVRLVVVRQESHLRTRSTSVLCLCARVCFAMRSLRACRGWRRAVERRERPAERAALLARVQTRHAQRAARAARERVCLARVERQVGERVGERRARSARQLVGHPPAHPEAGPLDAKLRSTPRRATMSAQHSPIHRATRVVQTLQVRQHSTRRQQRPPHHKHCSHSLSLFKFD